MPVNIKEIRRDKAEANFWGYFPRLIREFTTLNGQAGKGKTVGGIYLTKQLQSFITMREGYKPRAVVVATEIGITEAFGEFFPLSVQDFICQLRGINVISDQLEAEFQKDPEYVDDMMLAHRGCENLAHTPGMTQYGNKWYTPEQASHLTDKQLAMKGQEGVECWTAKNGVILYRSIVLCDEAHELLSADMSSNPVVRLMCNFIAKKRHFLVTLLVMTPNPKDIARRARQQVRYEVWANTSKRMNRRTGVEFAYNTSLRVCHPQSGGRSGICTFNFDPNEYFPMYDSHQVLSFSNRSLNIGAEYL